MIEIIRRLVMSSITLGLIAGNSDSIMKFYDDITAMSRQVATAGDMRTISLMLDYEYMKKGRVPREDRFDRWVIKNFKENEQKAVMTDHWGNEIVYQSSRDRDGYVLLSPGPDGLLDTEDDMKRSGP